MYQHIKVPADGQKITVNADFSLNVPDNPIIPYLEGDGTGVDVTSVVAGLHQGCWVDLHVGERWRRARLKWVSARATLFMFVSYGGQPHSMTRRSLEKLVRARHLRPVEAGAVVPRAIDALSAQQAEPAPAALRKAARAAEERVAA